MNQDRKHRPGKGGDTILHWTNNGESAQPLMEFVGRCRQDSKRTDIKKWLKFGQLMVDGSVTTAFDAPVNPGSEVALNLSRPFPRFRHPRIEIIYEDDHVLVVNKGYGLLSVGTQSHKKEENAYEILKTYVKNVDPANRLYVVHRLDRDTSGLMMFAKSEVAQEVLRHNWNNVILQRLYVAVLEGYLEEDRSEERRVGKEC